MINQQVRYVSGTSVDKEYIKYVIENKLNNKFDPEEVEKALSTPEGLLIYIARLSSPHNQANPNYTKLLRFLQDNGHISPFEMVEFTFEIVTSRGLAPQFLRHKSFSFQEFSTRYSMVEEQVQRTPRRQDTSNRQRSIDDLSQIDKDWFDVAQSRLWDSAYDLYRQGLKRGIAKECMRELLPMTAKTTFFMKGNLRSWIFYLQARCHESTQKEHREIALEIQNQLAKKLPETAKAFGWI